MNPSTLRALLSDNPWIEGMPVADWYARHLPDPCWPRHLQLVEDRRKINLIVGPRQAGKSTLIWSTLGRTGQGALYLNCEEPSIRQWLSSPALFLDDIASLAPRGTALFFEEVQALEEAGLFLKGIIDRRAERPIYATGSSAFDLEARTRESLAGRARRHLLLPFSLAEIPSHPGSHHREIGSQESSPLARYKAREGAQRAAIFGSYPSVLAATKPEWELADLAEAFVLRDVSDRFEIRHVDAFRKVVRLAASQIGNLVNFSEWASLAAVSTDTVSSYCRLLEEAHILRMVRPFVGGKRAEITSTPKVFFLDNGLRNQIFGGFHGLEERSDRGALLENLAFTELSKVLNPLLDSLRYWRSKSGAEVDFVVEHRGRRLAVEVKAGDAKGKISRGNRSFVEAYAPERLLIVHDGGRQTREIGECPVQFLGIESLGTTAREWLD